MDCAGAVANHSDRSHGEGSRKIVGVRALIINIPTETPIGHGFSIHGCVLYLGFLNGDSSKWSCIDIMRSHPQYAIEESFQGLMHILHIVRVLTYIPAPFALVK